jgi:hypothetical protein
MVAQSGWLVGVARSAQEESAAPIHGFIIVMSCFTPVLLPFQYLCTGFVTRIVVYALKKERKKALGLTENQIGGLSLDRMG